MKGSRCSPWVLRRTPLLFPPHPPTRPWSSSRFYRLLALSPPLPPSRTLICVGARSTSSPPQIPPSLSTTFPTLPSTLLQDRTGFRAILGFSYPRHSRGNRVFWLASAPGRPPPHTNDTNTHTANDTNTPHNWTGFRIASTSCPQGLGRPSRSFRKAPPLERSRRRSQTPNGCLRGKGSPFSSSSAILLSAYLITSNSSSRSQEETLIRSQLPR
jgi:hypothetical protein